MEKCLIRFGLETDLLKFSTVFRDIADAAALMASAGMNYTSMGLASSAALAAAAGFSGYVDYDGAAVAVAWQPDCSSIGVFPLCVRVRQHSY
jgi:hypothetical protein